VIHDLIFWTKIHLGAFRGPSVITEVTLTLNGRTPGQDLHEKKSVKKSIRGIDTLIL